MKICNIITNNDCRFFQKYYSDGGVDIILNEDIEIDMFETKSFDLGLQLQISDAYFAQIVPRSSISKMGIIISNSLIDANYTGTISLILHNVTNKKLKFKSGDRVCSVIAHERIPLKLHTNYRGYNSHGSTNEK